MSPPLPVPSKAAIHALRGIALGTSCAIGVIVEDRRRRICTLRTAIANKQKLKSSRQYHGTLESVTLQQLDDPTILGGDDLHWHQRQERISHRRESQAASPPSRSNRGQAVRPLDHDHPEPAKRPEPKDVPELPAQKPDPPPPSQRTKPSTSSRLAVPPPLPSVPTTAKIPNISAGASWHSTGPSTPRRRPKTVEALIAEIAGILDSNDEQRLDRALTLFLGASRTNLFARPTEDWLELSARLSKECQAKDRWETASSILAAAVSAGALQETQYYAHDPIPIINHCLRQADPETPCSREAVTLAAKLFLATFREKPQLHVDQIEHLGRRLITQALLVREAGVAHNAYWRVLGLLDDDTVGFTGWAIQELFRFQDHKNVIKFFLLNFSKTTPDVTSLNMTLPLVVESVEALKGWKASQVLRAYARVEYGGLRTALIMKLLQAHWRRHENFAMSQSLFEEAVSLGLLDRIDYPQEFYRVMVDISVKANETVMARSYYEELIHKYPRSRYDGAALESLALIQAKAGDWDGVSESLMHLNLQSRDEQCTKVFVMVLKFFADNHSVADVRDFVHVCTSERGIPMHRYIVSLVARKYGDCHDIPGFISWLEYCGKAGFALDSSFCNSILQVCRSRWNLSFDELSALLSKMRLLSPGCSDAVTQRIMSQAAIKEGRSTAGWTGGHRVRSRVTSVNRLSYLGRSTDQRDVYEAMNQELSSGNPTGAILIYKRAIRFAMPFSSHCLRLAVSAALRRPGSGSGSALTLIHSAHQQGHDVGPAVSALIRARIDQLQARAEEVILHMQNLITRFEALQIVIDPAVLTHMAFVCVKLGQQDKAVALCTLARDRIGSTNLCFSKQSFRTLAMAYSQTLDTAGMKKLIEDLLVSDLSSDKTVLSHLRSVSRQVHKLDHNNTVVAMLNIIQRGINKVKQLRAATREGGKIISEETLRIMGDALAEMQANQSTHRRNSTKGEEPPEAVVSNDAPRPLVAVA
ncbi:Uu.00g048330.m01.CDS01 [Anthostomella pinea]|uniref:Uu.00g048330.m01.CDS01 n=1 Tax=Anthostomella pinea TaxID=933095 RepID=A0AAI8VBP9_9PEZI|nr:Uu.00g048330.m01.CDS01 [Anthostomella pinea]